MVVSTAVRTVRLPSGRAIPVLGQGTWHVGENPSQRAEEIAALRLGIELGMSLIDTAEMYANGHAEKIVGEAVDGRRDEVFLVTKVLPQHATFRGTIEACEGSLKRLGVEDIDLYLLHWRGAVPLEDTVEAFDTLMGAGKILSWGVSNFDVADMEELIAVSGGDQVCTNQVLYNLQRRAIEFDLVPWCERRNIPIMAYSPIEQGRLSTHSSLRSVAARHQATPVQVALAWVLRRDNVCAIPQARQRAHVRENRAALDIRLSPADLEELDRAFSPPARKQPLATH